MPRNSSGVYTLPPGTSVTTGTLIESAKYNSATADIEQALNDINPNTIVALNANISDGLFTYSTTTTDADPGSGKFRLNSSTIASATEIYINNVNAGGIDVSALLDTFDDSTSTVNGTFKLTNDVNPGIFATFQVTGSVVDGTGYRKLTLTHIASGGTFVDATVFSLQLSRTGDKGDTGATGSTGATGPGGATVGIEVATRTALKAVDTTANTVAILTESGRIGTFIWTTGDYSSQITSDTAEGLFIKADAIASTVGAWVRYFEGPIYVDWFGAKGDNSTDDASAFTSALTEAAGKELRLKPGSNYKINSQISIPASTTITGWGATITKGGSVDLISMLASSKLVGLKIAGTGATYTGDGVVITSGNDQKLIECSITDMAGHTVDIDNDVGVRMSIDGGLYQRTTATSPAIRFANGVSAESAGDRTLVGVAAGGGNLIDTKSSQNTHILGCNMSQLTFGATSLKTTLTGCRIASAAADINVYGQDHNITGNVFAGDLVLNSGVARTYARNNVWPNSNYTKDNTANTNNSIETDVVAVAPLWKGDTTDPVIGNGTLTCSISRDGKIVTMYVYILVGSTTTFGSGNWYFQPPTAWQWSAIADNTGSVFYLDSGVALYVGTSYIASGTTKVYWIGNNVANFANSAVPITWATGDYIKLAISYRVAT